MTVIGINPPKSAITSVIDGMNTRVFFRISEMGGVNQQSHYFRSSILPSRLVFRPIVMIE